MAQYLTSEQFDDWQAQSKKAGKTFIWFCLTPLAIGVIGSYIFDYAVLAGLGALGMVFGTIGCRVYLYKLLRCPVCRSRIGGLKQRGYCFKCGVFLRKEI